MQNYDYQTIVHHAYIEHVNVKQYLEFKKGKKKVRDPIPLGSVSDISTLFSIYTVGKSLQVGTRKNVYMVNLKRHKTYVSVLIPLLFTQILRSVKASHSQRINILNEKQLTGELVCVCLCDDLMCSSCVRFNLSFSLNSLVCVNTYLVSCKCLSLSFLFTQAN